MEAFTLSREAFEILEQSFGGKQKAERLARAMETAIDNIQQKAEEKIFEQKQLLKAEIKDELKYELVTRELFEERFKGLDERFKSIDERFKGIDERFKLVDEKFKALENVMLERFKVVDEKFASLHFKMNIFIAIALISLTFANPTFVALIQKLF
ncbi:MAG: hypothetical protein AAB354_16910 [candidate division KSB1 bacterium]